MGQELPAGFERIEVCRALFDDREVCMRATGHDGDHSTDFFVDHSDEAYPYKLTQTVRMEATGETPSPGA